MNKYIYKVIKWLENPESVSQKERDENNYAAVYASNSTYSAASYAASYASYAAAENNPEIAKRSISKYFEITGENKQDYLNAIGGR